MHVIRWIILTCARAPSSAPYSHEREITPPWILKPLLQLPSAAEGKSPAGLINGHRRPIERRRVVKNDQKKKKKKEINKEKRKRAAAFPFCCTRTRRVFSLHSLFQLALFHQIFSNTCYVRELSRLNPISRIIRAANLICLWCVNFSTEQKWCMISMKNIHFDHVEWNQIEIERSRITDI